MSAVPSSIVSALSHLHNPLCCFALVLMLSCVATKRARSNDACEDGSTSSKRRRNDEDRGERRKHVVSQVLALDSTTFRKMFRMDKKSLLLLHSKVSIILDGKKTARNIAMAQVATPHLVARTLVYYFC